MLKKLTNVIPVIRATILFGIVIRLPNNIGICRGLQVLRVQVVHDGATCLALAKQYFLDDLCPRQLQNKNPRISTRVLEDTGLIIKPIQLNH